jgi:hypothetical protein
MVNSGKTNQEWFELRDVRRKKFAESVWVPLRLAHQIEHIGKYGFVGFKEEFSGAGSLAVPISRREQALKLGWGDIGLSHTQGVWAHDEFYKTAEAYENRPGEPLGTQLVLVQTFDNAPTEWHLNQDLVMALGLMRERDQWVRPAEDYTIVARLVRDEDGHPIALEIKNEFLRDYLAARRMLLRISAYHMRSVIEDDSTHINWPNNTLKEDGTDYQFEARILQINKGGTWADGSYAVLNISRTDVDPDDDVPRPGPENDSNVKVVKHSGNATGPKLPRILGEYWHNEIIEPAPHSPRIRHDDVPAGIEYIVDASGSRLPSEKLKDDTEPSWLWFRPEVIFALTKRRGGNLSWYTQETGGVSCSEGYSVHFGINSSDFITVFAPDVARLPVWQQRIWAAYNVTPEGKVSRELLSAQMETKVAKTFAPEKALPEMLEVLDNLFKVRIGVPLFRPHTLTPELFSSIQRFRALESKGLFALAKDIIRLTADRIDTEALQRVTPPPKGEKWGSLKSLEKYLATIIPAKDARELMTPLFGVYDLRIADSHLPPTEMKQAFEMARVNSDDTPLKQGFWLIASATSVLMDIAKILDSPDST